MYDAEFENEAAINGDLHSVGVRLEEEALNFCSYCWFCRGKQRDSLLFEG